MHPRTRISALAVAALLAPLASAGTPEEPEVEDAALDATAATGWGDITRAWMELSDDGRDLHLWVEYLALPETMPGIALVYTFQAGGVTWYAGAATAPTLAWYWGEWTDSGPADMWATTGDWWSGAPGRVRVVLPLAELPPDAREATEHRVLSWDIKPQLAGLDPPLFDEASGERPFALRPPDESAAAAATPWAVPSPAQRVPWVSVALIVSALGVGALGLRRGAE